MSIIDFVLIAPGIVVNFVRGMSWIDCLRQNTGSGVALPSTHQWQANPTAESYVMLFTHAVVY